MLPLEQELGWSLGELSLTVTVNLLLFGLTAPFAAALMQRFGMRMVTASALALIAAGAALSVFVAAPWAQQAKTPTAREWGEARGSPASSEVAHPARRDNGPVTPTASLPGWRHVYSGKVRDLYVPIDTAEGARPVRMLVVASDRVSAFDHVLSPGIPDKGELLTTLSLWWFDRLAGTDGGRSIPNHLVADHVLAGDDAVELIPAAVVGRAMLVASLEMEPIECVVRGYLTGSGWAEYRAEGTVCGIPLPAGLSDGDRLPEPIFTPAFKAPLGEHDENISFERMVEIVGADSAAELRDTSLEIYRRAARIAEDRGLILADTKFEFGRPSTDSATDAGRLTLADEALTSDSSRYWDAEAWRTGTTPAERMASFDKQIVRDWLAAHWDKTGEPPTLPAEIVERTRDRYAELLSRLTS